MHYVSKSDNERDMDMLIKRFDKLEEKLDQVLNG